MTNPKTQYTPAFREQALEKAYNRGSQTIKSVAEELNMNPWTLKNWISANKHQPQSSTENVTKRPQDWSAAERLKALMEAHGLDEAALSAFCRRKGIFPHHLTQWRKTFEASAWTTDEATQLRELKAAQKTLERELKRKEKALAEAAALLVLQKKFQALWEGKEK